MEKQYQSKKLKLLFKQLLIRLTGVFYIRKSSPVLFIKNDNLGDYILVRNLIGRFKQIKKNKISLMCKPLVNDFISEFDNDVYDKIILDPGNNIKFINYLFLLLRINIGGFSKIIYLSHSRTSTTDELIKHLYKIESVVVFGDDVNFDSKEEWLKGNSEFSHNLKIQGNFEYFKNENLFSQILGTKIEKTSLDISDLSEKVKLNKKTIVFGLGASSPRRIWSVDNILNLIRLLNHEREFDFVLVGGKNEITFSKLISEKLEKWNYAFCNYTGKIDFRTVASILNQSLLVITNDSGLLHLSVATKSRICCISNGNQYGRFVPYPKELGRVTCIFPWGVDSFEEIDLNKIEVFKYGSDLDINTISAETVFKIINQEKLLFNENF